MIPEIYEIGNPLALDTLLKDF